MLALDLVVKVPILFATWGRGVLHFGGGGILDPCSRTEVWFISDQEETFPKSYSKGTAVIDIVIASLC